MTYDKADWDNDEEKKKIKELLGKKGAIFNNHKHLKAKVMLALLATISIE